jgi:tetraacyldisaccharide 4'-kinase
VGYAVSTVKAVELTKVGTPNFATALYGKAPAPVISVGNLTVGGSGKTPMCVFLANELTRRGFCPAVLSRGYGRKKSRFFPEPVTVSLGLGPLVSFEYAGDEPLLTAELTEALVLVGADRSDAAREAVRQGADVLILDDGFQHLQLQRDANILMLPADNPLGNGRVLPAGPLREPLKARFEADIFVSVGDPEPSPAARRLAEGKPLFTAETKPGELSCLRGEKSMERDFLKERRFAAFCGLARPGGFKKTLASMGLSPVAFRAYPDHEPYGPLERRELEELLRFSQSEYLLTTLKDAVKLRGLNLPIVALNCSLAPTDPSGLMDAVMRLLPVSEPRREAEKLGREV